MWRSFEFRQDEETKVGSALTDAQELLVTHRAQDISGRGCRTRLRVYRARACAGAPDNQICWLLGHSGLRSESLAPIVDRLDSAVDRVSA